MKALIALPLMVLSAPAFAAKINDARCSDVNALDATVTPQYIAVIDGYNRAGTEIEREVDVAGIVTQAGALKDLCKTQQAVTLKSIRKDLKATAQSAPAGDEKKYVLHPATAKCEDFIALDEDLRPTAAFWMAGHAKAGQIKNGEVNEAFLARPVATLIEACKAEPKVSFFEKTRDWVKRTL